MKDNIDALMAGTNERTSQQEYINAGHSCNSYKRDETLRMKDLTEVSVEDPIWLRVVRAFDSPHHEPAYIRVGDKKTYVRYRFGENSNN